MPINIYIYKKKQEPYAFACLKQKEWFIVSTLLRQ